MARKVPTGAKHDRCIDHAEHPYPVKGMLCVGPTIGREGMIAFADLMAEKAAEHRAADLVRVETLHRGVKAPSRRKQSADYHVSRTASDAAKLAELVARFRAMRGLPVETPAADTYVAAVARKARAPKVAPVAVEPVAPEREPEPVAEPETHPYRFDDTIRHPGASRIDCAECFTQDAAEPVPAPVLVASEPSSRPTCPRCGQSFRKSGNGLAWHVANRPDCVKRPALSIAS